MIFFLKKGNYSSVAPGFHIVHSSPRRSKAGIVSKTVGYFPFSFFSKSYFLMFALDLLPLRPYHPGKLYFSAWELVLKLSVGLLILLTIEVIGQHKKPQMYGVCCSVAAASSNLTLNLPDT